MSISRILVAVGNWIEAHFPEKMTAEQVRVSFNVCVQALDKLTDCDEERARQIQSQNEAIGALVARVAELEKKVEVANSDLNKTKIMLLSQRQIAGR